MSRATVGVLLGALGTTGGAAYLLVTSKANSSGDNSGYTWGLVLLGVAATLWATFVVQAASDKVLGSQAFRLGQVSTKVTEINGELTGVSTAVAGLGRGLTTVSDAVAGLGGGLSELDASIQEALEGIRGLAAAAEDARNRTILTQLTTAADLRRFHGQASTLAHVKLGANRDLSNSVLDDCNWDDFSAAALVLFNSFMQRMILTHAEMPRANLSVTNLSGARLQGNFNQAVIEGAIMSATSFGGDWSRTRFTDCEVSSAYFGNCILQRAAFEATEDRSCDNVCFSLADLEGATFQGIRFGLVDFRWAYLKDTTFTRIDGAVSIANFEGAKLDGTDFEGVESSILNGWNFEGTIVEDARFPSDSIRSQRARS
jgi:uncharacterized protein YjbI with pentapeptide repeats